MGENEVDSNIYKQARSIFMQRKSFPFGLSVLKTLSNVASVLYFTLSSFKAHVMFSSLK